MAHYEQTAEQKKYEPLFNLVKNSRNWKNPINGVVRVEDLEDLEATTKDLSDAIIFYTGSVPTISTFENGGPFLHVTADGYYKAVGA